MNQFLFALCFAILLGCSSSSRQSYKAHDVSQWTLRDKIGQLLIVGYRDESQIKEIKPGGVALFSWSLKDAEQSRKLTKSIQNMAAKHRLKSPLLIATDHEGGKVIRLKKGVTQFPEAALIGNTADTVVAERVGAAMGEELSYIGVHANFAPVLDLGSSETFLANRVWGEDPKLVSAMTKSFVKGMHSQGVMSVAKHFPGHGNSSQDAHFGLPTNDKDLRKLWNEDLYPFKKAVVDHVPAMMTAHVQVPEIDKKVPASMSKRFLSRILRDSFGFKGVIVTDDLEMQGAQNKLFTTGDLALQALKAGTDMILIVWSKTDQRQIVSRIEKAIQKGEWSESELDAKVNRILNLKANWIDNPRWKKNHNTAVYSKVLERNQNLNQKILNWPVNVRQPASEIYSRMRAKGKESWNVVVSTPSSYRAWKKKRPQDKVSLVSKRTNTSNIKVAVNRLKSEECKFSVCVAVTAPSSYSSKELNRLLSQEKSKDFVWIHQGIGLGDFSLGSMHTDRLQAFIGQVSL